ncbi:carboxypeptidase B-like [Dermatophagoides pteronyssinus]|uniref:carboxypeptidase B-like n=1 Tax=Dermatophagoides pteronyssinus TaxID=6956 RepID=UPI003F669619
MLLHFFFLFIITVVNTESSIDFHRNNDDDAHLDYDGYQLLRIKPINNKQIELIKQFQYDYQLDYWNQPFIQQKHDADNNNFQSILTLINPQQKQFIKSKLNQSNIDYDIISENYKKIIEQQNLEINLAKKLFYQRSLSANVNVNDYYYDQFDYGNYHTYDELYSQIDYLANKYPKMAEKISIGYSYERRNIFGIKIGNLMMNNNSSSSDQKIIFVECGIHAREWISPAFCIWLAGHLLSSSTTSQLTSLIDHYQFIIIPSVNVDGYVFTHTHQRLWRKTRSRQYGSFCIGADPNRNWDSSWCQKGSSYDPCTDIYCGKRPFSEIETRQMATFLQKYNGKIFAYFAIHSYSQLWMFPYGYSSKRINDYNRLRSASQAAVNAIRSLYGTQYKYGSIADVIYLASGASVDYVYDKLQVKNSFALELRDTGTYGFQLPIWQIIPTCLETWTGIKAAIKILEIY